MLLITTLFYILWLCGKGGMAESTPRLVFNGVLLAHISINTDLTLQQCGSDDQEVG